MKKINLCIQYGSANRFSLNVFRVQLHFYNFYIGKANNQMRWKALTLQQSYMHTYNFHM